MQRLGLIPSVRTAVCSIDRYSTALNSVNDPHDVSSYAKTFEATIIIDEVRKFRKGTTT